MVAIKFEECHATTFGFERKESEDGYVYYFLPLSENKYDDIGLIYSPDEGCTLFPYTIRFDYVHEVQDIYRAITKKELKWDKK
jgi:hypothetical protein